MKLLLDQNISRRIVPALQQAFPGTTQVALAGLERADDREIWKYAKEQDFIIVTKDYDFSVLASVLGFPPKVVMVALGNCSNQRVLEMLLNRKAEIEGALLRDEVGLVELRPRVRHLREDR